MNKRFIELLKRKFRERIHKKTGWGCNEIYSEFEQAITEALVEIMDESS